MSLGLVESFNAPLYLPTYTVHATTTNLARRLIARSSWDGTVIKATSFSVGTGGYDIPNYMNATVVNPDDQALQQQVFLGPITKLEWANQSCSSYYCVLGQMDANALLGEIGIWSTIVSSPVPSEIGTVFLSALAHFPLRAKNSSMSLALRVLRQS